MTVYLLRLRLKTIVNGGGKIVTARGTGVCRETVPPRNVRSYTHEVLPAWLPEHELKKDDHDRHANMDGEKL